MMLYEKIAAKGFLSENDLREGVITALSRFGAIRSMLIVPPDITRLHSAAGTLTRFAYENDPSAVKAILPSLGTHRPMNAAERVSMFGDLPAGLFLDHDWRKTCVRLGEVPSDFVSSVTEGAVDYAVPVEVNRELASEKYDCILSVGQIVPHEVAGFAGHNKNLFVGCGGVENINKSHFLGAVYGMERIMGHAATPVRAVFDYAIENFLGTAPIVHLMTVMGRDEAGAIKPCGIFAGVGRECFNRAAELSAKVNITLLPEPLQKVVVYLDPVEYKSFWLGNKSIYRTRMAIADAGELIILAPGVETAGEDAEIDRLIRTYGYRGTPATLDAVRNHADLGSNLSAAAHLIHGSSEGRFSITYCTGMMGEDEVSRAGFSYAPVNDMQKRFDPKVLRDGFNTLPGGEEIYFISNPGTGLWAWENRYKGRNQSQDPR